MKRNSLLILILLAGCSDDPNPGEYTVSYRNGVRLPYSGELLDTLTFAKKVRDKDPIRPFRCLPEESKAYQEIADAMGGIEWGHPVSIIKDQSFPPLYDHKRRHRNSSDMAGVPSAFEAASPIIERPDLVGIQQGVAIFLSKQHGLLSVETSGSTPSVSCSLKLPGTPQNFFYRGNEIVVLTNSRTTIRSAVLRFRVQNKSFQFVDAVKFENQTILDARLFNSTLAIYTSWREASATRPNIRGLTMPSEPVFYDPTPDVGVKLLTIQWDAALGIDSEEAFLNDPFLDDPLMGRSGSGFRAGDVVYSQKTFKTFLSASDSYLVVSRDVHRTLFARMRTYSYPYCKTWNPQWKQEQLCYPNYERRTNPDYVAPNPATGDYSCGGKTLADCVKEAAPKVSQYIWVSVGQTCQMVWRGRCEETAVMTGQYPEYENDDQSEFIVYRFSNGGFTKLDNALASLNAVSGSQPASISFTNQPLTLPGLISNKDQLQFQNGHFYVLAGTNLHTLLVTGNSATLLKTVSVSIPQSAPAVVFSPDRLMISAPDYSYNRGGYHSKIAMFDLTIPSFPKLLNSFAMPGLNTQLILADSGVLGPGNVNLSHAEVSRKLEKLTLFSRTDGIELDNLLLGTEYDTLESSWIPVDDQRIRLDPANQRLFLPYSGRHHAKEHEPTAHRLNISHINGAQLLSERSFELSEEIARTTNIDGDRVLAFGNSSVHFVDHRSGDWLLSSIQEFFVPFATYRIDDHHDVYARIDRIGSKCRITTHEGSENIFEETIIAELTLPCGESELPIGFKNNLLFTSTRTGVEISKNGKKINTLDSDRVQKILGSLRHDVYCALEGSESDSARPVDFLDEVPRQIICINEPERAIEPMATMEASNLLKNQ